jgi:hypothetical protein
VTDYKVPYKKDGGLWFVPPKKEYKNGAWVNKLSWLKKNDNLEWRDPEQFEAELKLVHYNETPEGSFYLWADTDTNMTYPMVPQEMQDMLMKAFVEDGYIEGIWTIVRSDNNKYSLHLVEEVID